SRHACGADRSRGAQVSRRVPRRSARRRDPARDLETGPPRLHPALAARRIGEEICRDLDVRWLAADDLEPPPGAGAARHARRALQVGWILAGLDSSGACDALRRTLDRDGP